MQSSAFASVVLRSVAAAAFAFLTFAPAAMAQEGIAPPQAFELVDARGVDMLSLSLKVDTPTIAIGPVGEGGLSYTATFDTSVFAWRHSTFGGIHRAFALIPDQSRQWLQVTTLGQSVAFLEQPGGVLERVPETGTGSLTFNAGTNEYTYTALDGTISIFDRDLETWSPYQASRGLLTRIQRPNGEVVTFTYLSAGDRRRVTSIVNNLGYQLHFDYASQTSGTPDWERFTRVTAFNMAVDACSPSAISCTYSRVWPHLAFAQTSTSRTVTDAGGGITRLVLGTGGVTQVYRPADIVTPAQTVAYELGETTYKVSTVSDGLGTWTYGMPDAPSGLIAYQTFSSSSNPAGGGMTYNFHVYAPGGDSALLSRATQLLKVTDALGRETEVVQDAAGLREVTRPEGDRTVHRYNARGDYLGYDLYNKAYPTDPAVISARLHYDDCSTTIRCGRPTRLVDERGHTTDYTYDSRGNLLSETRPAPSSGAARPQTRYGYQDLQAWFRQPGGAITASGAPVSRPIWSSTCQVGAGQSGTTPAACIGTANEVRTATVYQAGSATAASNLLPLSVSTGSGNGALTATTSTTWSLEGDPVTVDGPLTGTADTVWTAYDAMRRPLGSIGPDPDGSSPRLRLATRTTYDLGGRPISVGVGAATAQTLAALNAMTVQQRTDTTYDPQGRKRRERLYAGSSQIGVTDYGYDAAGRPICQAVRMNPSLFTSLPSDACAPGAVGGFGPDRITRTRFDAAGQILQVQTGWGVAGATRTERLQAWTPNGKIDWIEDGVGNRSDYVYDGFDRLGRLSFPSPTVGAHAASATDYETYGYDAGSNPVTKRTRSGAIFTTTFDALDRITLIDAPSGTNDVAFTYDNLGRRLTASHPGGGTVTATWDALGRQLTDGQALGAMAMQYDLAGRRTRLTWPDGFYVTYEYDLNDSLLRLRQGAAGTLVASFTYDDLARRTGLSRANGVATAYSWDGASRLTAFAHDFAGTGSDVSATFSYNPASQIVSRTLSNLAYAYAPAAGSAAYGANGLNQTTSVGGVAVTWNSQGNLTHDGTKPFAYDAANRLVGSGASTLSYDPLDRLQQMVGTGGARYLSDGDQLTAITTAASGTAINNRLVRGPWPDELIVAYQGADASTPNFSLADERGSILAISGPGGAADYTLAYDEYGRPRAGNTGRIQYTGQLWLPDFGVYHYKARAYHPALGRFLQTDPVGYEQGLNLYAYVRNDPVNGTDPDGRQTVPGTSGMTLEDHRAAGDTVVGWIARQFREDPVGATITTIGIIVDVADTVVSPGPDATLAAAGINGARVGAREATEAVAEGIVYRRTNTETGRCYIGRCNSDQLYSTRQRTHDRTQGTRHEYEVVERAPPGRALREAEQRHIDANGGPTNQRNPNGGLENRRNEIDPRRRRNE